MSEFTSQTDTGSVTEPTDLADRLAVLGELIAAPRGATPLRLVPGATISQSDFRKVHLSGLDVGNYGYGDSEWYFQDEAGAYYPVVEEFPILMYPERIVSNDDTETVSLKLPQYEEAYTEMQHYNSIGDQNASDDLENISNETITRLMAGAMNEGSDKTQFPQPSEVWIDALHDSISQYEAYDYLAPMEGVCFLQLGGGGTHAVKALIAGARRAVLLTPMLGEARFAKALARKAGVADRLYCVIAVGEELPFEGGVFDAIYSGGCLHHMRTELAFAEIRRTLMDGGRFACVDPWKTLIHMIGTKVFGKRECGVFCRPIDPERLKPIETTFPSHTVSRHGPFLRYLFLGFEKLGLKLPVSTMMRIARVDDALGSVFGLTRRFGGSIVIVGQK